ncbi:hypothetical protein BKA70DRAFT_1440676 [Coprinopsis sp. MPI-PUGE-AT-0042]|nr:hypothetical protein BKA70DRAFT_1440676 [Coprinopsis sp. MPI-PUGE-AT-0042]
MAASPQALSTSLQKLPILPILKKGARMSFKFSKRSPTQDPGDPKEADDMVGSEGENEVESEDEDEESALRSISPGSDHSTVGDNGIGEEIQEDENWNEDEEDIEGEEGVEVEEGDRNHSPISTGEDELPLSPLHNAVKDIKKRKDPQGSRAKGKSGEGNFETPLKKRETRRKASQAPTQGLEPLPFEGVRTRQQRLRESQEPESASKAASASARSLRNQPTLEPIAESPTPRTPSKKKRNCNPAQKDEEPPSKRQKKNALATPRPTRTPGKAKHGASSGPKQTAHQAKRKAAGQDATNTKQQASGRTKSKRR